MGGVCYFYLLVLVWHHYDSAYRVRNDLPGTGRCLAARGIGVELLTIAVAALSFAGAVVYTLALTGMAGVLATLALAESRVLWNASETVGGGPAGRGGER